MRLMTKKEMKQFLKEVNKRKKFREALLQLVKNKSMNQPEIKTVYVPTYKSSPLKFAKKYVTKNFLAETDEQQLNCYKHIETYLKGYNKSQETHPFSKKDMIEFAKLHVNAALKEALESIPCLGSSSDIPTYEEVEEAVLNCYPENLIQ